MRIASLLATADWLYSLLPTSGEAVMGSAIRQGDLWGRAPHDWARLQEVQHAPLWESMLEATQVAPGTRFLDAGSGAGGAALYAAARGARVSGIDASTALIEIASAQVPEADFRVGDLEELPFPDCSFEAVIAASAIQYADSPGNALSELRRVSDSGGRVAVGLFGPPETVEFRAVLAAVRDALPEPPPGKGPFGLSSPGTLESLLEDAGMSVAAAAAVSCPFTYPDTDTFWKATVAAGPVQAAVDIAGVDRVMTEVLAAAAPFKQPDGSFRFENTFRYVISEPV